jgi:hypothetical protein
MTFTNEERAVPTSVQAQTQLEKTSKPARNLSS